ncbi:MAG: hypothetical protein ACKOA8_02090 [Deltaproteobacteria bacterium]
MKKVVIFILVGLFQFPVVAVHVLSEFEHSLCEEVKLSSELRVYKDPSLFVGALGEMYNDPQQGWKSLMNETPVLTHLSGTVELMRLGVPAEFKNFGVISKLYELADSRFKVIQPQGIKKDPKTKPRTGPLVIPVKVCGSSYGDSLGFVLLADFQRAQKQNIEEGTLPPSVYPNPVPVLKKN